MGSSSKPTLYDRARAYYQNPSVVTLTRHEALVLTNEPPEDVDKPYILSVIAKADAELEEIDALLSKMSASAEMDSESERRKKTEDYRTSLFKWRSFNQAIFSPLRRIPPEILSEIFSHLAPPTKDMGFFVLMEQWDIGVTWFLSLVCRRWRAVALSMPSLWSLVVISATMPLSLVECQMKRARKLQIYFLEDSKRNFETRVDAFELLCRYSHLWEDLSIFGTTPDMLHLLESIRDRVSSLRRLWIHWGPEIRTETAVDCFNLAPCLVDFSVTNDNRFIPMTFPAHQLTRYQLNGPWSAHQHILTQATQLVEAHIDVSFDGEPWPVKNPEAIISLAHLRRVFVSDLEILDYLKLPVLEGLASQYASTEEDPWHPSEMLAFVGSFIDRSSCTLKRITIKGCPDPRTATGLVQQSSSITEFSVILTPNCEAEVVNDLMTAFSNSESSEAPLTAPRLRSLYFAYSHHDHFVIERLVAMLKSRRQAKDSELREVILVLPTGSESVAPDPAANSDLCMLREEGLDVTFIRGTAGTTARCDWTYWMCP